MLVQKAILPMVLVQQPEGLRPVSLVVVQVRLDLVFPKIHLVAFHVQEVEVLNEVGLEVLQKKARFLT